MWNTFGFYADLIINSSKLELLTNKILCKKKTTIHYTNEKRKVLEFISNYSFENSSIKIILVFN